jgi:hypothetical protein
VVLIFLRVAGKLPLRHRISCVYINTSTFHSVNTASSHSSPVVARRSPLAKPVLDLSNMSEGIRKETVEATLQIHQRYDLQTIPQAKANKKQPASAPASLDSNATIHHPEHEDMDTDFSIDLLPGPTHPFSIAAAQTDQTAYDDTGRQNSSSSTQPRRRR